MRLACALLAFSVLAIAQTDNDQGLQAYNAKDYALAASRWRTAAQQGAAAARNGMGVLCQRGLGVRKDLQAAVQWFRAAADQNYGPAEYNLGLAYRQGLGVARSDAEAMKWFEQAASHGVRMAELSLGNLAYTSGDYDQALRWWKLAAQHGVPVAAANVGFLFAEGKGVERNFGEAAKWYTDAAREGNPQAQYALGLLYRDGKGVNADRLEAAKWLRLAASSGVAEAVGEAATAEKALGSAETARLKELVRTWKPASGGEQIADRGMLLSEKGPSMHPVFDPGPQVASTDRKATGIALNAEGYVLTFLPPGSCSTWRVRTENGSAEIPVAASDEGHQLTVLGPTRLIARQVSSFARGGRSSEPQKVVAIGFDLHGAQALRNAVSGVMIAGGGNALGFEFAQTIPNQGAAVLDASGGILGLALPGSSRLNTTVIDSSLIENFLKGHRIQFSEGEGHGIEASRGSVVLIECKP